MFYCSADVVGGTRVILRVLEVKVGGGRSVCERALGGEEGERKKEREREQGASQE